MRVGTNAYLLIFFRVKFLSVFSHLFIPIFFILYTTGSAEIVTVADPLTGEPLHQIVQIKHDPITGETTKVVSPLPKTSTGIGLPTHGIHTLIWHFALLSRPLHFFSSQYFILVTLHLKLTLIKMKLQTS